VPLLSFSPLPPPSSADKLAFWEGECVITLTPQMHMSVLQLAAFDNGAITPLAAATLEGLDAAHGPNPELALLVRAVARHQVVYVRAR
jgi:hypothetical protein